MPALLRLLLFMAAVAAISQLPSLWIGKNLETLRPSGLEPVDRLALTYRPFARQSTDAKTTGGSTSLDSASRSETSYFRTEQRRGNIDVSAAAGFERRSGQPAITPPATRAMIRGVLRQRLATAWPLAPVPARGRFAAHQANGSTRKDGEQPIPDMRSQLTVHRGRLIGVQVGSLVAGFLALHQMNRMFGGIAQPFKIGSDWTKDRALRMDELLHVQGSYRLARGMADLYRWAGVESRRADWLGAGMALAGMTLLEYIDGRRRNDEASYSDLIANTVGVTFAVLRPRAAFLQHFDLQLSYENVTDVLHEKTLKDYNRLTHWLSYHAEDHLKVPVDLGLGYGVEQVHTKNVRPQVFLGLALHLPAPNADRQSQWPIPLNWLQAYRFGIQVQIF